MNAKNICNLPAAGTMNLSDGVLVLQNGKAVYMKLSELLTYVNSASVEVDTTLTMEGLAADAAAVGAAIAGISHKYDVLWENSDPSAEFDAQTVGLSNPVTNYEKLLIGFRDTHTSTNITVEELPVIKGGPYTAVYATDCFAGATHSRRAALAGAQSVAFGSCFTTTTASNAYVTQNTRKIPFIIWGRRGNPLEI